jgi:hypothetical protein
MASYSIQSRIPTHKYDLVVTSNQGTLPKVAQVGWSRSQDVGQPGDAHPGTLTQNSQAAFQSTTLIHVVGTPS